MRPKVFICEATQDEGFEWQYIVNETVYANRVPLNYMVIKMGESAVFSEGQKISIDGQIVTTTDLTTRNFLMIDEIPYVILNRQRSTIGNMFRYALQRA